MRTARLHVPGVVHHVISRFVDREWFFQSDRERERYLWWLGRALSESDWLCIAYALMSSHIHLALVAGEAPLSTWTRRVNPAFAVWMNKEHGRLGPLFAERPKDIAKPPDAVLETITYIHNNPVAAGVVAVAEDSGWTSHRAYLGLDPAPSWLHIGEGVRRAAIGDRDLRALVAQAPRELPSANLSRIGHAARRHGALELATPVTVPLVARPFARVRIDPRRIIEAVCAHYELEPELLCSRRRAKEICAARDVVVHSALKLGLVASDIAAALGITKQSVSRIQLTREGDERVCDAIVIAVQKAMHDPLK